MKKIMKKGMSILLAGAMSICMLACGSESGSSSGSETGASGAAGDEITMKFALTEELNSLDPNYNYSATSMGMITNVNQDRKSVV